MIRALFCLACGAKRTVDLARQQQGSGRRLACFGCGHEVFTTCEENAPARLGPWLLTAFDRDLLRSFRIAVEQREVVG